MAICVQFSPVSMSKAKYDEIIRLLERAGAGHPPGRLYHCCYESGGGLKVVDVFDTPQNFERFGGTLMPILKTVGVDPGQPTVEPVHNTIIGR
jgi:hypothetical protein